MDVDEGFSHRYWLLWNPFFFAIVVLHTVATKGQHLYTLTLQSNTVPPITQNAPMFEMGSVGVYMFVSLYHRTLRVMKSQTTAAPRMLFCINVSLYTSVLLFCSGECCSAAF